MRLKILNIDVEASILVGDKVSDLQAGIAAGVKTNYLVRTGKAITEEGESLASGVFDDLASLVKVFNNSVDNCSFCVCNLCPKRV